MFSHISFEVILGLLCFWCLVLFNLEFLRITIPLICSSYWVSPSFRKSSYITGQVKLGVHVMRLCQIMRRSDLNDLVNSDTLVALLLLLEGHMAFNNVYLRHYLFCILQVLGGRWVPFFYECLAVLYLMIVFVFVLLFFSAMPNMFVIYCISFSFIIIIFLRTEAVFSSACVGFVYDHHLVHVSFFTKLF